MKHISIFLILASTFVFGQIPSDYYDGVTTQTGYSLKTALRNIITNGHISRDYDQLYDGAGIVGSQGYVDTHTDMNVSGANNYENDGTVLDFYSENPTGADPYNFTHNLDNGGNQNSEGDCYNREHLIPQSSFNSAFPMQSDIHHVIPTDCRVNNFRGSLVIGNVNSASWTSMNGSKRGSSGMMGYSGTVFEPIDEFKGDIARALLYFAVRYENTVDGYTSFEMFNGTNDQVFHDWAIEVLLDWHNNVDPVDQRERNRNNAAFNFQGNANPFVDHPEYANLIWGDLTDMEAPTTPTNLVASNPTNTTITLNWTASTDNVGVQSYDIYIDGTLSGNSTTNMFVAQSLTRNTNYCFNVVAKDAAGNISNQSNQDCETTTDNTVTPSNEIFFSEYIEGSGEEKALEIANFTGDEVDLSNYSIRLYSNGNSDLANPTHTYNFASGATVANEDVYVIGNPNASICSSEYDDNTGNATFFNGNDVVTLYKGEVMIDVIGTIGSSINFAANQTLVRNPEINGPSTTFDINNWTSFPINTCTDLGRHTVDNLGTVETSSNNKLKVYPNPARDYFKLEGIKKENVKVEVYNTSGKLMPTNKLSNGEYDVSNLSKGIYIIKVSVDNSISTHKLIKR